MDPAEPFVQDGVGAVLFAWVAGEGNRILDRGLTEEAEKSHRGLASDARERELSVWEQLKVSSLIDEGAQVKTVVDARWVLTWKVVVGRGL